MLAKFSDHGKKKSNKRTFIIKPAFGNIAKIQPNQKAMLSSRILVKTPAINIFKKAFQNHHDMTFLYRHGSNRLIFQQTNSMSKNQHIEKQQMSSEK